jgi:hypothetical protein
MLGRMLQRRTLFLALILLTTTAAAQQAVDPAAALRAQIDQVFREHAYDPPRFGPARWLPDGTAYAIVERTAAGTEIARYDAVTGTRSVTVRPQQLVPRGAQRPHDISN